LITSAGGGQSPFLSKVFLNELLDFAPGLVALTIGENHTLSYVNQDFSDVFRAVDLLNRPIGEVLGPIVGPEVLAPIEKAFRTGTAQRLKHSHVTMTRDGRPSEWLVDFSYHPVSVDGLEAGVLCLGRGERTPGLLYSQDARLETVGNFATGIAHDFNNVLQVIGGNLNLLSRVVGDNPAALKRIGVASEAVDRGSQLAAQLRSLGGLRPQRRSPAEAQPVSGRHGRVRTMAVATGASIPRSRPARACEVKRQLALVCEDEPLILFNMGDMLRDLGFEVLETSTLAEARATLQDNRVTVVLTDLKLPDGSGYALAEAARALDADVGLVFTSGQLQADEDAKFPGAVRLDKPYGERQFRQALSGWLD
jgi:CheY-like chemotaxis protein